MKVLSFIWTLFVIIAVAINTISFNIDCKHRLKRAADANSIELAIKELEAVLKYAEDNQLTSGYTSIIYNTPDEDIEYWYQNLKYAYTELTTISNDCSVLEKSNALMKLRETILDSTERGETVTMPAGLSRYPNNLLWALFMFSGIITLCVIPFSNKSL